MKHKEDVILHDIGGEKILLPFGAQVMNLNGIITLNGTAAFVWELLDQDCNIDELAIAVSQHFDVHLETAREDIITFITGIEKLGILE